MRAYDLYCGLGGWAEGFLAEGYDVTGFDIEAHDYGTGGYPGTLVLRDIRAIHGSELKDAACIVGSSPCQEFSYRAMPWKRAKALPPPYLGMELFNAQFRIQREASEAAGHHIPMVVENVRGAQKWVGRAQWNYGSFYLWGDVPALMPMRGLKAYKTSGMNWSDQTLRGQDFTRIAGRQAIEGLKWGDCNGKRFDERPKGSVAAHREGTGIKGIPHRTAGHWTNPAEHEGALYADRDSQGVKQHGSGHVWYRTGNGAMSSKSSARKAASAMIAKIPYPLAVHIARCLKPEVTA